MKKQTIYLGNNNFRITTEKYWTVFGYMYSLTYEERISSFFNMWFWKVIFKFDTEEKLNERVEFYKKELGE